MGFAMLSGSLYILGSIFSRMDFNTNIVAFWMKFSCIPAELGILFWFIFSNELAKESQVGIILKNYVVIAIILLTSATIFLLTSTNLLIDYSRPIYVGKNYLKWDFIVTNLYLLRIFLIFFKSIFPSINFFLAFRNSDKRLSVFNVIMFIASSSLLLGVAFSMIQHHLASRYFLSFYSINPLIHEFFILAGLLLVVFLLLNPKINLNETFEATKNFFSSIGYSVLLIIPYLLSIALIFKFIPGNFYFPVIILTLSGLVLLTHSTHDWLIEISNGLIRGNGFIVPEISSFDVNNALKYYSTPHKLQGNPLLKFEAIRNLSEKKQINEVEALRLLIRQGIESCRPSGIPTRNTPWLRYEILKMMAFTGAYESQIMWDLGFDVFVRSREEKIVDFKEPRYKITDASQYSATSARSFKRLRKEAIEMLTWKIAAE